MQKLHSLLSLLTLISSSASTTINCDYKFAADELKVIHGEIYECEVKQNLSVTSADQPVVIYGTHSDNTFNALSVQSLRITQNAQNTSQFFYFPEELDSFRNLQLIRVNDVGLLEIHRKDLQTFANLQLLDLHGNRIEYLETNLFAGNPKLVLICLVSNQISYIDPMAVRGLKSLSIFNLSENKCINKSLNRLTGNVSDFKNGKCDDITTFLDLKFPWISEKVKQTETNLRQCERSRVAAGDHKVALEVELVNLKGEKKDLTDKIQKHAAEVDSIQDVLSVAKKELLETQKRLEKREKEVKKLKAENSEMHAKLNARSDPMDVTEEPDEIYQEALNKIDDLTEKLTESEAKSKELNALNEVLNKVSNDNELRMRKLLNANRNLTDEIDVKTVEISNLNSSKCDVGILNRLTHPRVINKTIWYIAVPLNCLLTLITVAVIITCCKRKTSRGNSFKDGSDYQGIIESEKVYGNYEEIPQINSCD